jgi:hypothetical protein
MSPKTDILCLPDARPRLGDLPSASAERIAWDNAAELFAVK